MCNEKLLYQNYTKMYNNRTYLSNKATQKNMYNTKIIIIYKFWKRICLFIRYLEDGTFLMYHHLAKLFLRCKYFSDTVLMVKAHNQLLFSVDFLLSSVFVSVLETVEIQMVPHLYEVCNLSFPE